MLNSDEHGKGGIRPAAEDREPDAPDPLTRAGADAEEGRPRRSEQAGPKSDDGHGGRKQEQEQEKGAPADREGETEKSEEPEKPSKTAAALGFVRRHPIAVGVGTIVLVAAVVAGVLWYLDARHFETTDDAFIDARQFAVSPKVGGYVVEVAVTDNQHVAAGGLLARIDQRDYLIAIDQAAAQVEVAEAAVQSAAAQIVAQRSQIEEAQAQVQQTQAAGDFSRDENRRAQDLVQRGVGTVQRSQQTASDLSQAQANLARTQAAVNAAVRQIAVLQAQQKSATANVAQAKAQLEQARLNLAYTDVKADQPGRVARLTGARGQLVQPGQALSMFVPDAMWVTANFKETQLADMRPGQPVDMTIDAYPGRTFRGHVDSVQSGSGTVFSLLPAQNATGNYVKVVQRVPVKLVLDNLPTDVTIGPGMSVVPKVRVR
ncbi:efflux RND transporter periplasmic adaptor subunit [uncultured Enterovirga sp.]|uniref:HlyD family secretion protein n=1 Tax=uncultured Enterovirga sp. TaxID=2026352 RepID=UPI0035CA9D70